MKKNIIPILFFLTISFCFGQNMNGIATYKKEILIYYTETAKGLQLKKNDPQTFKEWQKIDKDVKSLLNDIKFKLYFNPSQSLFKVEDILESETTKNYSFAVGPDGVGIYYINSKNDKTLLQLDAYGSLFLIENSKTVWQLFNETKLINGYLCYKASAVKTVLGRKGIIKTPITAWYAPKLPLAFGPLGYGGLSGLIFDLTIGNTRFYIDKINLNPRKEIIVKKPTEGKLVSKDEFESIGLQSIGKMRNILNKN